MNVQQNQQIPVNNPQVQQRPMANNAGNNREIILKKIKKISLFKNIFLVLAIFALLGTGGFIFLKKDGASYLQNSNAEPQIYVSEEEGESNKEKDVLDLINISYDENSWEQVRSDKSISLFLKDDGGSNIFSNDSIVISYEKINNLNINDYVKNELDKNKEYPGFELLTQGEKKIGNVDFVKIESKNPFLSKTKIAEEYFGQKDGYIFRITTVHDKNVNTKTEINKVLAGLNFDIKDNSNVKGVKVSSNEEKIVNLYKPAVVRIYADSCTDFKYKESDDIFYLDNKSYNLCAAGFGTGFFVNSDGYVATNGHVAALTKEMTVLYSMMYGGGEADKLIFDLLKEVYALTNLANEKFLETLPEESLNDVDALARALDKGATKFATEKFSEAISNQQFLVGIIEGLFIDIDKKMASVGETTNEIYLQNGKSVFSFDKSGLINKENYLKADLIDSAFDVNLNPKKGESATGRDVALLKVEGEDFPTVKLGTIDDLSSGSEIIVMGYPGLAENELVDKSSAYELTATRGIVSSVRNANQSQSKLIQTDAGISHGNSGGPGFDMNGNVFGIATYGITNSEGTANYNYLKDIVELKEMMNKNNIENKNGKIDETWKTALSLYDQAKYKKAVSQFKSIKEKYPSHISIDTYISSSETKIANGEDRSYFFSDPKILNSTIIGGSVFLLSIVLVIVLSAMKKKLNKIINTPASSRQPAMV